MSTTRPMLWDVYEEHLDEAAFLWGQWEQALDAANYALDDVIVGPEERLLAHLDGLVLGGTRVAERLLLPALTDDDPGKVTAAAWALLQGEDADHFDLVLGALTKAETKETRAALGRAFDMSHRADLAARLLPLLETSAPAVQAVIVNVVSARAQAPEVGGPVQSNLPIETLLKSRNPELMVAALRALRRAPDPAYARLVEAPLASPYVVIRNTAIEAGVILGMRAAWQACSKLVARKAMGCRLPLVLLALGGQPGDLKSVIRCLDIPPMRRDALWALGFAGTVEAAEAALRLIDDEESGPLAAESFATITGAPLTGAMVMVGETDNTAPPPVDEDDDAPLPVVRPEDSLPTPNPERVRLWWEKAKERFQPAVRYLYGEVAAPQGLRNTIASGPTWRRTGWCLEVTMRSGVDVDASGWAFKKKHAAAAFPNNLAMDKALAATARV